MFQMLTEMTEQVKSGENKTLKANCLEAINNYIYILKNQKFQSYLILP